jgi:hypothetical protein
VGCAFFGVISELWQFPVSEPGSRQPPVTPAVGTLKRPMQSRNYMQNNVELKKYTISVLVLFLSILILVSSNPDFSSTGLLDKLMVVDIKFYESEGWGMLPDSRVYEKKFYKDATRYIAYEVDLHYPASRRRIDFTVHTVYLKPDGSLFQEWDCQYSIVPNQTQSFLSGGSGWSEPGAWERGQYSAVFYINNYEIGRESFTIE